MLRIYYAAAIDNCPDKGRAQLEQFKQLLKKYPIELRGAGIGESPIIKLDSSQCVKGVIAAHDLRELRECDILLVVVSSDTQAVATFMELEYARQLGLYIIVLVLTPLRKCFVHCNGLYCARYVMGDCTLPPDCMDNKMVQIGWKTDMGCYKEKANSIFLQTYTNMIIYSTEELETILKELTNVKDED